MVMPGLTMRKVSLSRASSGFANWLSACQAMSMVMTTVLPDPVAILRARRGRPGFDVSFAAWTSFSIQASPNFLATVEDRVFDQGVGHRTDPESQKDSLPVCAHGNASLDKRTWYQEPGQKKGARFKLFSHPSFVALSFQPPILLGFGDFRGFPGIATIGWVSGFPGRRGVSCDTGTRPRKDTAAIVAGTQRKNEIPRLISPALDRRRRRGYDTP
jgi:hypothetical protein